LPIIIREAGRLKFIILEGAIGEIIREGTTIIIVKGGLSISTSALTATVMIDMTQPFIIAVNTITHTNITVILTSLILAIVNIGEVKISSSSEWPLVILGLY
jgi:hypothetical protein